MATLLADVSKGCLDRQCTRSSAGGYDCENPTFCYKMFSISYMYNTKRRKTFIYTITKINKNLKGEWTLAKNSSQNETTEFIDIKNINNRHLNFYHMHKII